MTRVLLILTFLGLSACADCEEITGISKGDVVSIDGVDGTYVVQGQTYYSADRCLVFLLNQHGEHGVFSDAVTFLPAQGGADV